MVGKYHPPFNLPKKMYKKRIEELMRCNKLLRVQINWMKKEMAKKNDQLERERNRTKIITAMLEAEMDKVEGGFL